MVTKLNDTAARWLSSCCSVEEIQDGIIMEQFLSSIPEEVRVFVRERKPKTAAEAGKWANDHEQARKFEDKGGIKRKFEKRGAITCHN